MFFIKIYLVAFLLYYPIFWGTALGEIFWIIVAGGTVAIVGIFLRRPPFAAVWRRRRFAEACRDFHWQREHLEARFAHLLQIHAKPDSSRPADCDFSDDVAYVRNRSTGELSAFVAVSITLELPTGKQDDGCGGNNEPDEHEGPGRRGDWASRGGGAIREATAVFRLAHDRWETDGRAIFNLSPSETIRFYQHDLEMIGQELAKQ